MIKKITQVVTETREWVIAEQSEGKSDENMAFTSVVRQSIERVTTYSAITFCALLIALSAGAQTSWVPVALQVFPDGAGGTQITWDITWNGDTIAKGGPYPTTVELSYTDHFYLPPACFTLTVHDSGCNGFGGNWGSGGSLSLYRTDQMIIIGNLAYNYGCMYQHEFCLGTGYTAPCENNCPSDINGDGIVNVTDLNMMLSDWGQTCPQ